MSATTYFDFNDQTVARAYDDVLVPSLFQPWATQLIQNNGPWEGLRVLDIASGTGVVAAMLADYIGPEGVTVASDINPDMLKIARERCADHDAHIDFLLSPAHELKLPTEAFDAVVCQQGFQYFSDRRSSAAEMYRVLSSSGRLVLSTWCPIWECEPFGAISEALRDIGEEEISDMMRRPFDFLDAEELADHFAAAGFKEVSVRRETQPFVLHGGVSEAVETAYATPIGPMLHSLSESKIDAFREALSNRLAHLTYAGVVVGRMASNVLTAQKNSSIDATA
jgi:SAM-dependent methyltransferase